MYNKPNQTNIQVEQQNTNKQEPIEFIGYYKGKILHKKGVVGPGKKTSGSPYTIYKLSFGQNGKQYDKNFNVFNDLGGKSLKLADLVEGNDYRCLYNQEHFVNTDGTPGKRNKLFFIGLPNANGNLSVEGKEYINQQYDNHGIEAQSKQAPLIRTNSVLPVNDKELAIWETIANGTEDFGNAEEFANIAIKKGLTYTRAKEIFNILG